MRRWALLLGGLNVWAAHFFGAYAIGEIVGASVAGKTLLALLTLACLAADAALFLRLRRMPAVDPFDRNLRSIALTGVLLSAIAVLWQALPGIFTAHP